MAKPAQLKIGAVSYLNTKPLVCDLRKLAADVDLVFDLPSRLADRLAAGELDVALIPSVEFLLRDDYRIVSDACIGCRGPVLSVNLHSRVPMNEIRSLALDEGSRTSAALVRILLKERFDVEPELEPFPIGADPASTKTDAVLLIGDRAINGAASEFKHQWDLGDQWCRWSELPFVFAMWVARNDAPLGDLPAALAEARNRGVARLKAIASEHSAAHGLSDAECLSYLRDNLYFYLGPRERSGLELFNRRAAAMGLVPPDRSIAWEDAVDGCRTS